jgi:hypothetical protein
MRSMQSIAPQGRRANVDATVLDERVLFAARGETGAGDGRDAVAVAEQVSAAITLGRSLDFHERDGEQAGAVARRGIVVIRHEVALEARAARARKMR